MIVNREQLKNISGCDYYSGSLIHQRFSYKFFREKVFPAGNIIAFRAPMRVLADGMIDQEDLLQHDYIYSQDAINFCFELTRYE